MPGKRWKIHIRREKVDSIQIFSVVMSEFGTNSLRKQFFTNTNANSHLVIIVFDELESARQEKV